LSPGVERELKGKTSFMSKSRGMEVEEGPCLLDFKGSQGRRSKSRRKREGLSVVLVLKSGMNDAGGGVIPPPGPIRVKKDGGVTPPSASIRSRSSKSRRTREEEGSSIVWASELG